jgi:heme-degrading monooxygenase HmoA
MIARIWRGITTSENADAYLAYLERTGLAAYRATPGNRAALALRRIAGGRAEFLLVTLWTSQDAIRAFAGPELDRAVFYPEDDHFLIERGEQVDHFDVVFSSGDVS